MRKKDFIKQIRDYNKFIRGEHESVVCGVFINGAYFFYNSMILDFDDKTGLLSILDKNKRAMAYINYDAVKIGLTDWDI